MDSDRPTYHRPHYHIRWERKGSLDWECFQLYSEAKTRAVELAEPNEVFTIEEVSSNCPLSKIKSKTKVASTS